MMRNLPLHGSVPRSLHPVVPARFIFWVFIGATCGFFAIAAGVTGDGPPASLDQAVAVWFHTHRTPGLTTAMRLATGIGSTLWVTGVALSAALMLTRWRRVRAGVVFGAVDLVGLVGFSRLELGAHYVSDVLGAVTAGLAWPVLCFTTTEALRRRISTRGHP